MEHSTGRMMYRPPLGFPQHWRDEPTGELQTAVLAYIGYRGVETPEPNNRQIELLRDYLVHYIGAPAWAGDPEMMAGLRRRAAEIESVEDVSVLISDFLEIGLDPL